MGDIPGLVKISVSLKIQPNDGAVYFKVDGQRFGQNRTIKLLTGAKYKIEVSLRPGTVQATLMTLEFLRQSGKSNSTTTTNGIIASGETALAVSSTNANQMKHAVSCGSIKRPSTEEMGNQYCWTISLKKKKKKIYLFKPARSLNKGIL
ncbi:CB1 cannabinoid receptor-interacting protein 1 isoform 2-T2 [Passerculus sandwichensis]